MKNRKVEIILSAIIMVAALWFITNYKLVYGMGNSMDPTIKDDSWLLCKYEKNYAVGDIVLYRLGHFSVVHRIAHIESYNLNGRIVKMYTMKGDNNEIVDTFKIYDENIVCKVKWFPRGD